jgi:hypothetical protein
MCRFMPLRLEGDGRPDVGLHCRNPGLGFDHHETRPHADHVMSGRRRDGLAFSMEPCNLQLSDFVVIAYSIR